MSKLIPMNEAAGILGMTEDQVAELRSNNEIFGYRDGATWKFKMSELERVADELGITLSAGGSAIDSVKGKIDNRVATAEARAELDAVESKNDVAGATAMVEQAAAESKAAAKLAEIRNQMGFMSAAPQDAVTPPTDPAEDDASEDDNND